MNQIWNIFRKDARHYWRESLVSAALLCAYGWIEVRGWTEEDILSRGLFTYGFLSGLVDVLVPVAWAFLVVRTIQGESLVGDRQFWITRPYEWKKLLVSKILFLLVFLNLPLLILDEVLLAIAGFHPSHHVVGLLWMQLLILLFLVLPTAALASITATIAQALLGVLAIALYMVGMAALASQIPNSDFSGPVDFLSGVFFFGTCVGVIIIQYARRRTGTARLLIIALGVVILIILVATPYRAIVAHEFPILSASKLPFQLSLLRPDTSAGNGTSDVEKDVTIQLPFGVSGISSDSILRVDGIFVSVDAPGGVKWNSGWKSPGLFLFPEQKNARIDFAMQRKVFDRLQSTPVDLRFSVAFTLFHDGDQQSLVLPRGEFAISDGALCSIDRGYAPNIRCRAPLRRPPFLLMTTDMANATCPLQKGEVPPSPGDIARGWTQNGDSGPAELDITPVVTFNLYLSHSNGGFSTKFAGNGVCPGSRVLLSNPTPGIRNQFVLKLDGLRLGEYREQPLRFTFEPETK
jgi:hypothetical protein